MIKKEKLEIEVIQNHINISLKDETIVRSFRVSFMRTLRIPDDDKVYPLPAGVGYFPIKRVEDYKEKVPKSWLEHGGVFFPMWQREAMWMSFGQDMNCPFAIKVAAGKINAISGKSWSEKLEISSGEMQDYAVAPPQLWIDGFNTGKEIIRQFVAMPLGMGYTVEGQITGKEEFGGVQIQVYPIKKESRKEPKNIIRGFSHNSDHDSGYGSSSNYGAGSMPSAGSMSSTMDMICESSITKTGNSLERGIQINCGKSAEMGLASGGRITQKIYKDPHGIDAWNQEIEGGRIFIHIVNSEMWEQITGEKNPASPITKESYRRAGIPWFEMYDEGISAVDGSAKLAGTKSVSEKDKEHGFIGQMDNSPIETTWSVKINVPEIESKTKVKDGNW